MTESTLVRHTAQAARWHDEPWPWLLAAGPVAVIVAGAVTTWIAFSGADGLVADDYYKQGLAINRRLAKSEAAARLGLSGEIELDDSALRLRLDGGAVPQVIGIHWQHTTRSGHDQRLVLGRGGDGLYRAARPPLAVGHWHVVVEPVVDSTGARSPAWQLTGAWNGASNRIVLDAQPDR